MTTSTTGPVPAVARPGPRRRRLLRGAAVLGAAAAAATVWLVAVRGAGVDLRVVIGDRTESIGLGPVLGVSLVVGLLGWALLAALESRSRRATSMWTAVAVAVVVLSLVGPISGAVTPAAAMVLVALHLTVAAVLIPLMRRSSVGQSG
jgi:hypothetical protein